METYIGTKIVRAEAEEKDGRPGYAVVYEDGYRSWSPKAVFEHAYRLVTPGEMSLLNESTVARLREPTVRRGSWPAACPQGHQGKPVRS